ncbi:MAG: ketoacyl-ACP synthase III [Oscillospiraceae bacterium]|nr:ketoacyl-ACP synthase III [Oscillospiraceae bacterium]
MFGINILGTGSYAPELTITNDDMAKVVETSDDWISTRTGIKSRHYSNGELTWQLGAKAAQNAIEAAGISPEEIGLVVFSTITPDFSTPSCACMVQNAVGAVNAAAFDLNAACTGFVYSLDTAKRFLQTDESLKYVLVVSAEVLSRIVDFNDRTTCILFGDGAGAVVIERSEKLYSSYLSADGSGNKFLYARNNAPTHPFRTSEGNNYGEDFTLDTGYLFQDGKEVYKFATKALPTASSKAAEKIGFDIKTADWFIPHQANIRIIETAAKNFGVPMDKFITNLDRYGNTSSASMAIAFDEAVRDGRVQKGQKICFVGFGAGLTLGSIILEY